MDKEKLKVLVVDDDAFVRDMLSDILESSDYIVKTAEDGADAFKKTKSDTDINLVISDMNMPNMNGIDLIKKLRDTQNDVPVIILTSNNEISVAIEAMKIGADDYMIKDENIEKTVLISVDNVMEKYRLKMQNIQLMEDLAYKNRELERMVFVDGLTGIQNRRYFDDTSIKEWKRAARARTPISILIADIDFFKLYNDTYGHQKGDDCLRKVATALNSVLVRSGDFVSRYGGEEFVAVLPNTDMEGATIVAKNMRSSVISLETPHKSSTVSDNVTISLGGGSMVPPTKTEPSGLISLVDKALYAAKQDGRDRIKMVDQESVEQHYSIPLHFVDPSDGRKKG